MSISNRRGFLTRAAGAAALGSFWTEETIQAYQNNVRTAGSPSDLRITDLRFAHITGAPMRAPIIRIDTNQGISGYGEVRDGASVTYALMLKSRLLGKNPCEVDKIFRSIKQFGFHARQAGGVCGVEMALWDLAGKAYNVPAYQLLGGKFRDRIRLYCDTTESHDAKVYGERMKKRREEGFTWLKMDLGIDLVEKIPGCITSPLGMDQRAAGLTPHMFTGMEITDKGIGLMCDYVAQIREVVGWDIPLAADHFGHIGVNSCIRLGRGLAKYNLAWLEDMIPWQQTELWKQITNAVDIPTLTGEDIYLKEPFIELARNHAVDILHPDLATSGGLLETKKIGDACMEYGHAMAMHFAGTPISFMANVHCAAATENFLVLEHHSVDVPWWSNLVAGNVKPLYERGFAVVPDKPGLGVEPNPDEIKKHLAPGTGYFEPTENWNNERSWDRLYS
ncbi:MAG: mandelate racemase/muconate lactonizing enzyme family protein [Candidatus Solibacter usitatus]|nr:mandelate racemase/muconate lactonizing enzyme family protein [Candidatus Solibacter usitatus]